MLFKYWKLLLKTPYQTAQRSFFLLPPQSKLACLSLLHLLFLVTIYEYDWTFAYIARMNWFPAPLDLYCISCLDPIIFFLTFLWSSNISLFLVLSIAHNFGSCPVSIICSLATPCALFLFLHPSCFGLWASLFFNVVLGFFFLGRGEVVFFNIGIHDQNLFSTWELDQHLRVNSFILFIFIYIYIYIFYNFPNFIQVQSKFQEKIFWH